MILGAPPRYEPTSEIDARDAPRFHVFAALAEFERDLIRERANAGLAAARRSHVMAIGPGFDTFAGMSGRRPVGVGRP